MSLDGMSPDVQRIAAALRVYLACRATFGHTHHRTHRAALRFDRACEAALAAEERASTAPVRAKELTRCRTK